MELVNRINNQAHQIKENVKTKAINISLLLSKILSGAILGLTFALVLQEMMKFGEISFLFIILMVTTAFTKATQNWGFITLVIFDLFCILIGMLLRMYIIIAPN